MLEQLLNGNDYNLNTIMLFGVIAILMLMVTIAIGFGLSALFTDKDIFLGIATIAVAIIGAAGIYVSEQLAYMYRHTNSINKLTKLKPSKKVTSKIITTSQKMEKPSSSHSKMINQNGYKNKLKQKSSTKTAKLIKSNTKTQSTVYQNQRSSRKETAYGKFQ